MIEPFETEAPLLRTARDVNDSMPEFTVETLRRELEAEGTALSEASVLILGLTYRPGVEEIRASPSLEIAAQLCDANADVYGVDPLLDDFGEFRLTPLSISEIDDSDFDGIVAVTSHHEFDDIHWDEVGRDGGAIVIDGRDTLNLTETNHRVYTIGSGRDV
jgi:UDP-N-acetyl-D-mannosaminuronic acid dehydrogenase